MAVYEHLYGAYEGESQSSLSRFLVIPRYAIRDVFKSKMLTVLYIACFVYPLIAAILIYLHHNTNALALLQINVKELIPIDRTFFRTFLEVQGMFSIILTVLVGPPLISKDLVNNALPLYLCRPLTRAEYVAGKATVIAFLLSTITWIPGLLLFLFQVTQADSAWLTKNWWMAWPIFLGSLIWILLLSLLALAVSSILKWRVVASGALLAIFFIPSAFGEIINSLFLTHSGRIVSIWSNMNAVWMGLFGLFERETGRIQGTVTNPIYNKQYFNMPLLEPPLWASWLMVFGVCAVAIFLLSRRVRAYEVIK